MPVWSKAQEYLLLALGIEHYVPGYVDAYFGPSELRQIDDRAGKQPVQNLVAMAGDIRRSISDDLSLDLRRKEFLLGELGAMQTLLRSLLGEHIDIAEEANGLYGISPRWVDESVFEATHKDVSDLLPRGGSLPDRYLAYDIGTRVPADRLAPIFQSLLKQLREKTVAAFHLPDRETVELAYVQDKPWGAYNWYLGDSASRVELNTDAPYRAIDLPNLVAHEAYPGHHTEHAIKEHRLVAKLGQIEYSILPCLVPSAVVSEGIATSALDVLVSRDELIDWLSGVFIAAGLPTRYAAMAVDLRAATMPLSYVDNNALFLLYREGSSDQKVLGYIKRYSLWNDERANIALRFYKDPLWRSYAFTYAYGHDMVTDRILRSGNPKAAFGKLLEEPTTPTSLLAPEQD